MGFGDPGRCQLAAWWVVLCASTGIPALAQEQVLVQPGTPTRYLANATDPGVGATWVQPAFDDSTWQVGPLGLGYETGSGAQNLFQTTVPSDSISVYSRTDFTLADPGQVFSVLLGFDYDDGYIAWINGVEVARSASMPPGPTSWNTLCANHESSNGATPVYEFADVTAQAIPLLDAGVNTLAVGVWNSTVNSSDQVIVPWLSINAPVALTRGPYLQQGSHERVTVRWRTDLQTDSQVLCGTNPGALAPCGGTSTFTNEHEVDLFGLIPDTEYFYAVGSSAQVVAGGDAEHRFRTAPFPGTARPTRIWILGDSGTGNANAAAVRDAYYAYNFGTDADVWLMLGDNAYNDGTDGEYQAKLFDMYPDTLIKTVLWPTIGNHDAATSNSTSLTGPYYDSFTLPDAAQAGGQASGTEAYYSFDRGNIHFIVLNSEDINRSPGSTMLTWLAADLAATTADWIIAFWHRPPYSKGSHDSDTELNMVEMRTNVVPLLDDYGVDMTFTGHSHDYERSYLIDGHYGSSGTFVEAMKVDGGDGNVVGDGAYSKPQLGTDPHTGTVHTVAGSSGKTSGGTLDHPAMFVSLNVLGSVIVDIVANRADVRFLDDNGTVRDEYTIVKGGGLAAPVADFDALPIVGQAPLAVNFIDLSDNFPDSWNWDFDNNGVTDSQAPSPQHTYDAGIYSVALTVSNMVGSDQAVQEGLLCVHAGIPGSVEPANFEDGVTFSWQGLPAAIDYDVTRGDLSLLRGGGGQLNCLANNTQGTSVVDGENPASGNGYFYLVRAADCATQTGSYNGSGPSQTGNRDSMLQGSPGACACDPADDGDGDFVCDAGYDDCIDSDFDGFGDPGVPGDLCADDNCPATPNPAQTDTDGDNDGDACDNCPLNHNPIQGDADADGFGNACDNCAYVANPAQGDADADGIGNVCDACPFDPQNDPDLDMICGDVDNCPDHWNATQTDQDTDSLGDTCDPCPLDRFNDVDGDGACGDVDNCPTIPNPTQQDADSDGLGDACDACTTDPTNDVDLDGICGLSDNCPEDFNPAQTDTDGDGIGDACDGAVMDTDGDGIEDSVDNCPQAPNPTQADSDADGVGNLCDNCRNDYNPDQTDTDSDGKGDACDPT